MVYTSFGNNQQIVLFFGSSLFLTGLLLFLVSNFEFADDYDVIFPAVLLILGINFLMLFFDNPPKKNFLAISLTAIASAVAVTIVLGTITINNFVNAIGNIGSKYWPVIVIAAGLIILLSIEHKKK
jgi:hypothetical protein